MDTASHLVLGATLAGLAYIEPAVAAEASLAQAVWIGTLIGSHAPDFDTVLRLRGFASYLQYHRGVTHSIPALFVWPVVIALPLCMVFHLFPYWHVLLKWVFIAVAFHVFLDTLNSYGVQSASPFSQKWIHLDILSIFEPFLFVLHSVGLMLWLGFKFEPIPLFIWIYALTFVYIVIRSWQHHRMVRRVINVINISGVYHIIPTLHWFHWKVVIEADNCFYTGKILYTKIVWEAVYPKQERNTAILATMGTDGVRAFLGFAQRIHVTCNEVKDGYEVSWSDVRFNQGSKLSFGVDVQLDKQMNVVHHRIGWRKKAWDPPFV
ncbi:metal-dependent hydrolase [Paenibacillus thalictri]|uniref:Metal-dependent hydrolase n=1 Tax=Paenibacillus thalictri TaxID=2527873 RepID=A0A4Q9DRA9_9BACL|nr:metal-dependent hydrolase [Paenibacillus thalictri]